MATRRGTARGERLDGTAAGDSLLGLAGKDKLFGLGGNDGHISRHGPSGGTGRDKDTGASALLGRRLARGLVLAIAFASTLLAALAARDESLTWDAPVFIVAGLSYWQTGDHRLNSEAPPLAQQLLALPVLLRAAVSLVVFVLVVSAAYGRVLDIRPLFDGLAQLYVNTNADYHSYLFGK